MKRFILLALLLVQCSSPISNEISPTSIDVEDFNEHVIELSNLPFDVLVSSDWNLETTSFAHQLWKTSVLQLSFQQESTDLSIPIGAQVIPSLDNSKITSFCLEDYCVIQVNGHDLIEAHAYTDDAKLTLKHLR